MDFLIHHLLGTSASRVPEKEALVAGSCRLSYESVERLVSGLAAGLREAGAERGDRIAILLDHSVPLSLSIFAISKAGAVFVPINHVLFPEQVGHILRDCSVRGLITTKAKLDSLVDVISETPSLTFAIVVGDGE